MRRVVLTILFVPFVLVPAHPLRAQEAHTVTEAEMDALVADRAAAAAADREAIRALLRHRGVREVAERAGLDIRRVESAVGLLDAEAVEELAPTARRLDEALAGGGEVITISVTTLIIALLVLIIILVA